MGAEQSIDAILEQLDDITASLKALPAGVKPTDPSAIAVMEKMRAFTTALAGAQSIMRPEDAPKWQQFGARMAEMQLAMVNAFPFMDPTQAK